MESEDDVASALLRGAEVSSDMIALFDADLYLRWANRAGCRMLGYTLEEVVGRSGLEFLHPDILARVGPVIARILDPDLEMPLKPGPVRLRTSSGEYIDVEMTGGGRVGHGDDPGEVLLICRPNDDDRLHDEMMDLLTNHAPSAAAFTLVPAFGQWRQPLFWHGAFFLDDDGSADARGDPALLDVVDLGRLAMWSNDTGNKRLFRAAEELGEAAAGAAAAGLTNVAVQPVLDPLYDSLAFAVFAQHSGSPEPINGSILAASQYVLDATARVLALVLGWRSQVLQLRRAAQSDPLTGLANRAGLRACVEQWNEGPTSFPIVVLSIDLDGFKSVNDTYGHPAGDELLVEVSARLREITRPTDVVARLGGDEFAIVAPGTTVADAEQVAERIVAVLGRPFHLRDATVRVGASVGVASTSGTPTIEAAMERADQALYQAKAAGRGRWHSDPR